MYYFALDIRFRFAFESREEQFRQRNPDRVGRNLAELERIGGKTSRLAVGQNENRLVFAKARL